MLKGLCSFLLEPRCSHLHFSKQHPRTRIKTKLRAAQSGVCAKSSVTMSLVSMRQADTNPVSQQDAANYPAKVSFAGIMSVAMFWCLQWWQMHKAAKITRQARHSLLLSCWLDCWDCEMPMVSSCISKSWHCSGHIWHCMSSIVAASDHVSHTIVLFWLTNFAYLQLPHQCSCTAEVTNEGHGGKAQDQPRWESSMSRYYTAKCSQSKRMIVHTLAPDIRSLQYTSACILVLDSLQLVATCKHSTVLACHVWLICRRHASRTRM